MKKKSHKINSILICILLLVSIVAVYWPVYKYDFLKYDDNTYINNNANVKNGLNFKTIGWAFTSGYAANWHPLTWLSLMIDYQLFKNWAGGYHLVNVIFHILNTLLLFYLLMQMTNAQWPSAFVAAAFAIHPLHVESVAWIAERKDVLSTFFLFLTMIAYVYYIENKKLKWYLTTLLLFVLGLMSKPMLVTLPFVLLLLDYWPLERKFSYKLLAEKVPFFILSFFSCVITFIVQQRGGATTAIGSVGFQEKISNAAVSYLSYIIKMIWPTKLALLYPFPSDELTAGRIIFSGLLLLLITIFFIYLSRRYRFFAMGWFWYLGTLVPVIGLVQVGIQGMADRYTYITLTGLFIIIAFAAKEFIPPKRYKMLIFPAAAILICWAITAHKQLGYWKNSITLFEHTLQVTEDNYHILNNYVSCLINAGRIDDALEQSKKMQNVKPGFAETHSNLGCALLAASRTEEAIDHFRLAIKFKPQLVQAYYNLAFIYGKQGKFEDSISYCNQALKIQPDYIDAYLCLAITYTKQGKFDQVVESCNKALEYDKNNIKAFYYLGAALKELNKMDEAIKVYRTALTIEPGNNDFQQLLEAAIKKQPQP